MDRTVSTVPGGCLVPLCPAQELLLRAVHALSLGLSAADAVLRVRKNHCGGQRQRPGNATVPLWSHNDGFRAAVSLDTGREGKHEAAKERQLWNTRRSLGRLWAELNLKPPIPKRSMLHR